MRLRPDQLDGSLRQKLAPVYIVTGDEPLQAQEAADAIRAVARQAGFTGREVFFAESGSSAGRKTSFDWSRLLEAMDSPPLFGDRNVLDLRMNSAPDKQGAAALIGYASRVSSDNLLLINLPRLKPAEQKGVWFLELEKVGVVVQVWPLEGPQLLDWLERRMQRRGLTVDRAATQLLASLVEGNLLAAAQEVEKLHILYGNAHITSEHILQAVADRARYDVFTLADTVLAGQGNRVAKVLTGLQAEGEAAPIVLWALAREIRLLLALHGAGSEGFETQLRRLKSPDRRKPLLQRALRRLSVPQLHILLKLAARTDETIKGMIRGDPWDSLLHLALGLAGCPVVSPGLSPAP